MGNNRLGSATRLRYAVDVHLWGGRLTFPRFRLHGREWIIGIVLTRCSATRCLHFWKKWVWRNAPLRSARPATRCLLFWCVSKCHFWDVPHGRCNYGGACNISQVSTAWQRTDHRHSFDWMVRYAVFALLEKLGMTQRSATQCAPRYAVLALLGCLQLCSTFSCNGRGELLHTNV